MRTVPPLQVDGGPAQSEELAAAQPVEHAEADRCGPAVVADRGEEAPHVVLGPRRGLPLEAGLDDLSRHADACCGVAADVAGFDGFGQDGTQHHAEDHDAAPGVVATGGEAVEPAGDVVAVELVEADRAEVADDALAGPLVLRAGFPGDVDAAGDPLLDELADRAALAADVAGRRERRCRPLRRAPRGVRAELSRPALAGHGVDAVDAHDPLVALAAHRRSTGWFPRHHGPPLIHLDTCVIHGPKTAEDPTDRWGPRSVSSQLDAGFRQRARRESNSQPSDP